MDVEIHDDPESLARAAAATFAEVTREAAAARGRAAVALAGGETPRRFHRLLAAEPYRECIPWTHVHLFWGDERCVPPADPRSNYGLARADFLDRVPLPAANRHPVPCDREPAEAAAAYETELRRFFGTAPPHFDLVYLGLGRDGHTASLFPGSSALRDEERWVREVTAPDGVPVRDRVTFTPRLINAARLVVFLVTGADKAEVVRRVLEEPAQSGELPARLIRPQPGRLRWLLDRAAASRLRTS
ncbi:MAG: 6-phosphogluconolactonase [Acidobacteriota bacterium]